jgi:hypothetical protein
MEAGTGCTGVICEKKGRHPEPSSPQGQAGPGRQGGISWRLPTLSAAFPTADSLYETSCGKVSFSINQVAPAAGGKAHCVRNDTGGKGLT